MDANMGANNRARTIGLQRRYCLDKEIRPWPSNHCSAAAQLAADRTVFAAERTYAAWVRTGLLAMASGIGAKALLSGLIPEWLILVTGSVLVLFSAFCFGAAGWRHLELGVSPPRIDVSRIQPWVLVGVNGFLALVALSALVGIWFGRPAGVSS